MSNIVSSVNDISVYMNEVNKIPLLSEEEERYLAIEFQNNGCRKSAQKLVLSHLRLVVKLALNYRNYGAALQDLISEGNIGLIHAVKKFRLDMKCRLSTYASWWIRSAIQEFILKSWSLLKINASALKKKLFYSAKNIRNKINLIDSENQSYSSSSNQIQEYNNAVQIDTRYMLSIDSDDNSSDPGSISNVGDEACISQECSLIAREDDEIKTSLLRKAVDSLTQREKIIISRRRLQKKAVTLKALSDEMNISPERVRQIEQLAIRKMQNFISSRGASLISN